MHILTAIDLAGMRAQPLDAWSHRLVCPWCGEDAWATADYMQCYNASCKVQAASPEDILAKATGDYHQAAAYVAKKTNNLVDTDGVRKRTNERAVMDLWLKFCTTPSNAESIKVSNRIQEKGFGIQQSRFGALVINTSQMRELVDLAELTGADYPDSWLENSPGAARAFCVQSKPHTIDRIIIMRHSGRSEEIVWNRYSAGFCSLIGLMPHRPRLLVASIEVALRMQHSLAALGKYEEIASIYTDLWRGDTNPRWEVNSHLLTAVPRFATAQENESFYGPKDLIYIQQTLDQFPGIEKSIKAAPIDYVMQMRPRDQVTEWSKLRFGILSSTIQVNDTQMNPTAASLFEQLGSRPEDSARLISRCKRQGRLQLASDVERLSLTRIIHQESNMSVKETAADYRLIKGKDTRILANFSLKVAANVSFRNQPDASFCHATLRCGAAEVDVLFPQGLLGDRVQALQDEMQRQMTIQDKTTEAGRLPTIIEVAPLRKYVMPHLRAQVSDAKTVIGVDRLGWSADRKSFTLPGFRISADGRKKTSSLLCPAVPILTNFEAITELAEVCPPSLDKSCQDLVAMILASCVRYFRRCSTKPMTVMQSSDAMTALDSITRGLGQHQVHELNPNMREGNRIDGIHGYPVLAAGPRSMTAASSQPPYFHLTDVGYKLPTSPTQQEAHTAGRAAQYCLQRVVEWCLSTGGDKFAEVNSLDYNRALIREGNWLVTNVVKLDDWEVSQSEPTAIEKLLGQIPYEEAARRMSLVDGTDLMIDVRGLTRDHDAVLQEGKAMGTVIAIENDNLMSSAVKLLPAISNFYGQAPDVKVL